MIIELEGIRILADREGINSRVRHDVEIARWNTISERLSRSRKIRHVSKKGLGYECEKDR